VQERHGRERVYRLDAKCCQGLAERIGPTPKREKSVEDGEQSSKTSERRCAGGVATFRRNSR
jgi:hypothetical protein